MKTNIYRRILMFSILLIKFVITFFLFQFCNRFEDIKVTTDFEPVETVYFVWNEEDSSLLVNMIAKISKYENLSLFIRDEPELQEKIRNKIEKGNGNLSNIVFIPKKMLTQNNWIRDYAPMYVKQKNRLKMVKFPYWDESNELADFLSKKDTVPLKRNKFKTLGGTRELNGAGTGIFVEEHEKFMNGKEKFNKKEHEEKLKKTFNLKKVIWLKKGIPQDELPSYGPIDKNVYPTGSCHHIDEFCRFIAPNKIMLSYVTEKEANNAILKEARKRLDENYRILKNSTDQDGNPFEIIRMPFAPVVLKPFHSTTDPFDYRTEVTSYMNFLITNHTVILPTYRNIDSTLLTKAKEDFIIKSFYKHLPEKEVVFLDIGSLNARGGGIHCISAAKPLSTKINKRSFNLRFRKRKKV
jgi:agmatine deiminase